MPPTSFLRWRPNAQERVEQGNELPTRSIFFATLAINSPFLHASNPSLSEDCLICYRPFAARTFNLKRVKLPCGHRHFCRKCLTKWAREGKNTCPCCRKELWQLEPPHITSRLSNRSAARQRRNAIIALQNFTPDVDQLSQTSNASWSAFESTTFGMFGPSAAMPMPTAPRIPFPRVHTPSSTIHELALTEVHVSAARLIDHSDNLTTAAMQQRDDRPPPRELFAPFRIRIRIRVTGL